MVFPVHDSNPIRYLSRPWVTYLLIALNVGVFVVQSVLPGTAEQAVLVSLGMIPAVLGEVAVDPFPALPAWATLFTYSFLHADIWHLLTNMLFLWIFGDNVEDAMGHAKYALFYLLCGALAGLSHFAVDPSSPGPLVGASGAISGIIGAYLLLYPRALVVMVVRVGIPIPLPVPAFWALGGWIGLQLFLALSATGEPVAFWAHVGGAATGAALIGRFKRREVRLFGK